MKTISVALLFCVSFQALASAEAPKLKIKDVKALVKTMDPQSTCMDEYLKRRKELLIKLGASPAVAVAGTIASTYTGALTAGTVANVIGVDGWATLGWVILGAAGGAVTGAAASVANGVTTGVTLSNNALIVKALAEQELREEGYYTENLYGKYLKHSKKDIPREDFVRSLNEYDDTGALCDGTMVKKPKFSLGTKLKFKVAKLKDLVRYMDR